MDGRRSGTRGARGVRGGAGDTATTRASETPAQAGISAIKTRIAELHARDAEALEKIEGGRLRREQMKRVQRLRNEVAVEMIQAKAELAALVAAPIPSGVDPTAGLPDELLILILLQVGWGRGCEAVCQRWRGLSQDVAVQRQLREGRWDDYAAGWLAPGWPAPRRLAPRRLAPRKLYGHDGEVLSLAVGSNGKVYSASTDNKIRVWSTRDGKLLGILGGHFTKVLSLAVAEDGTLYSGSFDRTVRVRRGENGHHLRTLTGHTDAVSALAIGANGNVFSGSVDTTVRVWSGRDGAHLHTLAGHTSSVDALAASRDKVYSGSRDTTIRVWSTTDGSHLQTLTGHADRVAALALGPDDNLVSGSGDGTVRVWSGNDGTHLRTLQCDAHCVESLAVGQDGRLFIGTFSGTVLVWRAMGSGSRCIIAPDETFTPVSLCISAAGTLYTGRDVQNYDLLVEYGIDEADPEGVLQVW